MEGTIFFIQKTIRNRLLCVFFFLNKNPPLKITDKPLQKTASVFCFPKDSARRDVMKTLVALAPSPPSATAGQLIAWCQMDLATGPYWAMLSMLLAASCGYLNDIHSL